MKRMKSDEVRKNWADVLQHVRTGGKVIIEHYNKPIARIVPIEETVMAPRTNTSYGTWTNRVERYSANLATTVVESLGDYGDDYDVDALTAAYRDAINDALPAEVTLAGDEFLGPAKPDADEWDGYPTDDLGQLDIKAIVDGVDFWEIAEKYETSGS